MSKKHDKKTNETPSSTKDMIIQDFEDKSRRSYRIKRGRGTKRDSSHLD